MSFKYYKNMKTYALYKDNQLWFYGRGKSKEDIKERACKRSGLKEHAKGRDGIIYALIRQL